MSTLNMKTGVLFVFAVVLLAGIATLGVTGVNAQTNTTDQDNQTIYGTDGNPLNGNTNTLNSTSVDTNSTTTSTTTGAGTVTPGVPNTGFGGSAAMNMAILLGSAIVAVGGATFVARRFAV